MSARGGTTWALKGLSVWRVISVALLLANVAMMLTSLRDGHDVLACVSAYFAGLMSAMTHDVFIEIGDSA